MTNTFIGDSDISLDDVIEVEDTQDTAASPTTKAEVRANIEDIIFIPIVYGDCDNHNNFVVQ